MNSATKLDHFLSRVIDLGSAIIGLIVLSPVVVCCAIWIKCDSPGPIFYRAKRLGRYGTIFYLYKFRSMVVNADQVGPGITAAEDRRVTASGRFLRKTKLDELPQLLNVLRGEMSLVGPRPEDPRFLPEYTAEQRKILDYRPGITSAASLAYRHEEALLAVPNPDQVYREQILPDKLAIDLAYFAQRSLYSDLRLMLRTVLAIFK